MVLAVAVGKPRTFGRSLLLYIVSFGIYGIYWHYKAHKELFDQFELKRMGRDEGLVWFILGLLVFSPLMWIYQYMFVGNVQLIKQNLRLPTHMSPGKFLGFTIPGGVLFGIGFALVFYGIFFMFLGPIILDDPSSTAEDREFAEIIIPIAGGLLLGGLVGFVAGGVLLIVAYLKLHQDINEVWYSYAARMRPATGANGPAGGHQPPSQWQH